MMQSINQGGISAELTKMVALDKTKGQIEDLQALKAQGEDEKAAREFEALFASMMVTEMRKTMPEGFFGDAAGSDVYGQWFDRHMGEALARDDALGLAGMLKAQLGLERVDGYERALPTDDAAETDTGAER